MSMTRAELIRLIRQEIRLQADVILAAKSRNSQGRFEDIAELYPEMATIPARATMRPYGLVSRAPADTTSVIGRQSSHEGNRIVLGHRDEDAPDLDSEGDVMLYNAAGAQIYLNGGNIMIGDRNATKEAARKGDQIIIDSSATAPLPNPLVQFVATVTTVLNTLAPGSLPTPPPTSFVGVISQGSSSVKIKD
jgi:hypothetical protein